jgi:nitroimidazol reductase NimA-like FMN-containing flavoprotein (pyridoxamine 5'-phosphate oxidase superfamily)
MGARCGAAARSAADRETTPRARAHRFVEALSACVVTDLRPLDVDGQTRIRRLPQYQTTDRHELFAILDAGLVAHVAIIRDGAPVTLPLGFARDGDSILLHGSTGSDFIRRLADGARLCVSVTHLDGLLLARSLFDSSMQYRAVVIHGVAEGVPPEEKGAALLALSRHLIPERRQRGAADPQARTRGHHGAADPPRLGERQRQPDEHSGGD